MRYSNAVVDPYDGVQNYEVRTAKTAPHFMNFDITSDIEFFDLSDLDLYADQDLAVIDPNDGVYQPQEMETRLDAVINRVKALIKKGGKR